MRMNKPLVPLFQNASLDGSQKDHHACRAIQTDFQARHGLISMTALYNTGLTENLGKMAVKKFRLMPADF